MKKRHLLSHFKSSTRIFLLFALLFIVLFSIISCSAPNSQYSSSSTESTSTNSTDGSTSNAQQSSETDSNATSLNSPSMLALSDAIYMTPGNAIQESSSYLYIYANNCLQRYAKDDLSNSTILYRAESGTTITGYCLLDDMVYLLLQVEESGQNTTSQVLLLSTTTYSTELTLTDPYLSQIQIYNHVLYLTGTNRFVAYDLNTDYTIGNKNSDYDNILKTISSFHPVYLSSDWNHLTYYDIPYCIATYGKLYFQNSAGALWEADPSDISSLNSPTLLANQIPGSIIGMTDTYVISIDNYQDTSTYWTCYTTNLETGIINSFSILDGIYNTSSVTDEVLGLDDSGIYIGLISTSRDADDTAIYRIKHIDYETGNESNLFSFSPEPSLDISTGVFAPSAYRFLNDGFYYVRSQNYQNLAFVRFYSDITEETEMGNEAFYDSGLSDEHIYLKQREYTKYDNSDYAGYPVIHIKTILPQLDSASSGSQTINQTLRTTVQNYENSYIEQAQNDYLIYLDSLSQNSSTDSTFPYEYRYRLKQITFQDSNYIDFCLSGYLYNGAAHGYTWNDYYLFDKQNGALLSLEDILQISHVEFSNIVLQILHENIALDSSHYYDDAVSYVTQNYIDAKHDYAFYLTPNGITVVFGPNEISPSAFGASEIVIPYADLALKINIDVYYDK